MEANTDGHFVDPSGHPMPPCIVTERGESLDIWAERARPDRPSAFLVRTHICLFGQLFILLPLVQLNLK